MPIPKLKIQFFKKSYHSFHFFGVIGFTLGFTAGLTIAYLINLPLWPIFLCAVVGAGVLIGLTLLYKKITGREDLVYYQHELAILLGCLILLWALGLPVLAYLDITLMGIGIFLFFGRMGCFSVGCCHGRPHKHGVIYSKAHVEEGFPFYYQGIRIFPIQLVESFVALVIVIVGVSLILSGSEPGTALLVYSIIYGFIRVVLEFFRGDAERPYWLDFSEAQWTTLGIFLISLVLSHFGLLPYYAWHVWVVIGLIALMVGTTIYYRFQSLPIYKIWRPKHVQEIAAGIEALNTHEPEEGQILMAHTSLGLKISKGVFQDENQKTVHYTLSKESSENLLLLNMETATEIGKLLQILKHSAEQMEILEMESGVFHILFSVFAPAEEHADSPNGSTALDLRRNLRLNYN